ncbi:LOW QUALITY PROTEIN: hypothetical protein M8C21_019097, partial [Ambrosia artemisiifolia]
MTDNQFSINPTPNQNLVMNANDSGLQVAKAMPVSVRARNRSLLDMLLQVLHKMQKKLLLSSRTNIHVHFGAVFWDVCVCEAEAVSGCGEIWRKAINSANGVSLVYEIPVSVREESCVGWVDWCMIEGDYIRGVELLGDVSERGKLLVENSEDKRKRDLSKAFNIDTRTSFDNVVILVYQDDIVLVVLFSLNRDVQVSSHVKYTGQNLPRVGIDLASEAIKSTTKVVNALYINYEPTKELYQNYEPVVEKYTVSTWPSMNKLPLVSQPFPQPFFCLKNTTAQSLTQRIEIRSALWTLNCSFSTSNGDVEIYDGRNSNKDAMDNKVPEVLARMLQPLTKQFTSITETSSK